MTTPAESLARRAHATQLDRAGRPYVEHLERVVAILLRRWPDATEDEVAAAWLHDVLEDTELTMLDLRANGISRRVTEIVWSVSRFGTSSTYKAWIAHIARHGSHSAIRIKLADNEDNSDPARVAAIPDGPRLLWQRYAPARVLLEQGLRRFEGCA